METLGQALRSRVNLLSDTPDADKKSQHSRASSDSPSSLASEYCIVICGDDDEPTGRSKILDKFAPDRGEAGLCRQPVDINGTQTLVELVEFDSLESDEAMLRYHLQYADAFVFVFSRYSPRTLETAQRYRNVIFRAFKGVARDEDEVSFFLIGNADKELPLPAGTSRETLKEESRTKARMMAQNWGCPYLEVDTAEDEAHGVDEAIICIGQTIKSLEKPVKAGVSNRKVKKPKKFLMRRMLSKFVG